MAFIKISFSSLLYFLFMNKIVLLFYYDFDILISFHHIYFPFYHCSRPFQIYNSKNVNIIFENCANKNVKIWIEKNKKKYLYKDMKICLIMYKLKNLLVSSQSCCALSLFTFFIMIKNIFSKNQITLLVFPLSSSFCPKFRA